MPDDKAGVVIADAAASDDPKAVYLNIFFRVEFAMSAPSMKNTATPGRT